MVAPARTFDHRVAAARGMSWMMAQTIGVRSLTFLGQIVLGWLLFPRDFGLYALALSIANAVGAVRNGGITQLMLRQTSLAAPDVGQLTQFAFLFNSLAAGALLLIAPIAAAHFDATQIGWLVAWIALSFPTGTFAAVFRCQLTVAGRYRELTLLGMSATLFWQVGTIGMAFAGFGAYSYVVPTALQGVVETLVGFWFVRSWPSLAPRIRAAEFLTIFRDTRWVMLGAAMLSLATTGDYFAVGLFADAATVGKYFFAFQLVVAVGALLSNGVELAMPSILSRLDQDRSRQSKAVLELVGALMLVSWPLAGLVSVSAAPGIHLIWAGKWDEAAIAVALIALCIPAWVYLSVSRALIEARGRWRLRFAFLTAYGVGGAATAGCAAAWGSLQTIALCVTIFYVVFALCLLLLVRKVISVKLSEVLRVTGIPALICLSSTGLAWLAVPVIGYVDSPYKAGLIAIPIFVVSTIILNSIVLGKEWKRAGLMWTLLRNRSDS